MVDRREFLRIGAAAAVASSLPGCREEPEAPRYGPRAVRKPASSRVAILAASGYDADLRTAVEDGLALCDQRVSGLRVVLKPNLVEFDPDGVINTHPTLIGAAVEALRGLGAREVTVAEGPGHRRDNEYLRRASGLEEMLRDAGSSYVDLNSDAVRKVELLSEYTGLHELYLPETVLGADLLISMPKLKTHHWAGVTLSMKNMFGVVPGAVYGWPKNLLHWVGIESSILDINAALEMPRFNIVDGIVGMQGNGPIQGTAVASGVIVFGQDPVAVDSTCARLMNIDPQKVGYIREAGVFLGNVDGDRIAQVGEALEPYRQDFAVLESFRELKLTPRAAAG
jgi:uncharacterized protein (DUF362 family)